MATAAHLFLQQLAIFQVWSCLTYAHCDGGERDCDGGEYVCDGHDDGFLSDAPALCASVVVYPWTEVALAAKNEIAMEAAFVQAQLLHKISSPWPVPRFPFPLHHQGVLLSSCVFQLFASQLALN